MDAATTTAVGGGRASDGGGRAAPGSGAGGEARGRPPRHTRGGTVEAQIRSPLWFSCAPGRGATGAPREGPLISKEGREA